MKNKAIKIILGLSLMLGVMAVFSFAFATNKVYAYAYNEGEIVDTLTDDEEETTTTTPEATTPSETQEQEQTAEGQEEVSSIITDEDRSKIESLIEYLKNLNKDELMDVINTAKTWLIAGGITTALSFLAAVIGLIAACLKLAKEKNRNSQMSEQHKQEIEKMLNKVQEVVIECNKRTNNLLLSYTNNMTDAEKKAMEANVNDVKAKIMAALDSTTEQLNKE